MHSLRSSPELRTSARTCGSDSHSLSRGSRTFPPRTARAISSLLRLDLRQSVGSTLVLFLQPIVERGKVLDHCLSVELLPCRFLQHFPPRTARTRRHQFLQEVTNLLVAIVVGVVRV